MEAMHAVLRADPTRSLSHRRLLGLRLARGLSREQLAVIAGLSSRTIFGLETEGVQPQRATLRVLAEALGCDPAELLSPSDDERLADKRGVVTAGQGRHGSG